MVIKKRLNGEDGKQPVAKYSSIKSLANGKDFEDLLRGDSSLGKCMQDLGTDALPSPVHQMPNSRSQSLEFNSFYPWW